MEQNLEHERGLKLQGLTSRQRTLKKGRAPKTLISQGSRNKVTLGTVCSLPLQAPMLESLWASIHTIALIDPVTSEIILIVVGILEIIVIRVILVNIVIIALIFMSVMYTLYRYLDS